MNDDDYICHSSACFGRKRDGRGRADADGQEEPASFPDEIESFSGGGGGGGGGGGAVEARAGLVDGRADGRACERERGAPLTFGVRGLSLLSGDCESVQSGRM